MAQPDDPADLPVVSRPTPQYLWIKNDQQIYVRLTRHGGGDLYESEDGRHTVSTSLNLPEHSVFSDNPSYDPNKDHHLPNPASRYFAGTELQSREKDLLQQIDEKDR